jgi:hypothetical protein
MSKPSLLAGARALLAGSAAILAIPADAAAAPAEPGVSVTRTSPEKQLELSVGLSSNLVWLVNSEMPETMRGTGKGVVVDAAYYPVQQLAIVAEAWWTWSSFGECVADASCFSYVAQDQAMLTAGVRLPLPQRFSLQATMGAVRSALEYGGTRWAPVIIGAVAWRYPVGPVELGLELRTSAFNEEGSGVTSLGGRMMASKSW